MKHLETFVKKSFAEYINISPKEVSNIVIKDCVGYSDKLMIQLEHLIANKKMDDLRNIILDCLSDSSDNLIFYEILTLNNGSYLVVVFDPFELYEPTVLKFVIKI